MPLYIFVFDDEEEYYPCDEYEQQTCGTLRRFAQIRPEDDEPPAPVLEEDEEEPNL